ncbi:hypothetical protein SUGI_0132610 [Cryptomeria japonica]|nr:hypothetical protein SUGI_0132610 [Cryptomeria japonica]
MDVSEHIIRSLQFHVDVTLIDLKEYFEVPWAMLRCMVEPKSAKRSLWEHILYDYLVIAIGSTFNGSPSKPDKLKQFEADYDKISSAQTVLIIGGEHVEGDDVSCGEGEHNVKCKDG